MSNFTDFFSVGSSSNLLEIIQAPADGRAVQGVSNSYTLDNVTSTQTNTTSYADVTGSHITYIPPTATKYIRYEFKTHIGSTSGIAAGISMISHWRMYVDDNQITQAYKQFSSNYYQTGSSYYGYGHVPVTVGFVFDLTAASDDFPNGKFSNWTTGKEIKIMSRGYSTSYDGAYIHNNVWRDGTGASGNNTFTPPLLTVIAYS